MVASRACGTQPCHGVGRSVSAPHCSLRRLPRRLRVLAAAGRRADAGCLHRRECAPRRHGAS
eukprot:4939210-Prymnesium_polylepis.1